MFDQPHEEPNAEHVEPGADPVLSDKLVDWVLRRADYGDTVRTADMQVVVGLSEDTQEERLRWVGVLGAAKRELLTAHHRFLRADGGGTYTIVPPEKQAVVAGRDAERRIRKALRTEAVIVAHTAIDRLDRADQVKHDNRSAASAARSELIRRSLRRGW